MKDFFVEIKNSRKLRNKIKNIIMLAIGVLLLIWGMTTKWDYDSLQEAFKKNKGQYEALQKKYEDVQNKNTNLNKEIKELQEKIDEQNKTAKQDKQMEEKINQENNQANTTSKNNVVTADGNTQSKVENNTKSTNISSENKSNSTTTKSNSGEVNSTAITQKQDNQEEMVWVGDTGTKYHYQSCRTLKGNGHQITLQQALAEGRAPCKVCH